jgi:hypothetical protein
VSAIRVSVSKSVSAVPVSREYCVERARRPSGPTTLSNPPRFAPPASAFRLRLGIYSPLDARVSKHSQARCLRRAHRLRTSQSTYQLGLSHPPAPCRGAAPLRAQTAQWPGLLPRHTPSSRAGPNGAGPGQRMRELDQARRLRRAWRSWECVNPVSLTLRRTYSQAPTSVWECVGVHSFHRLPRYELPRLVSRAARRLAHSTPTPDADLPWPSVLTVVPFLSRRE